MKTIKFNEPNFEMFGQGKVSTVRLGKKDFNIGEPVLIKNEQTYETMETVIRKVEYLMYIDLSKRHATNDGFSSVSALKCELEECYGERFNPSEVFTVLTFNMID